MATIIPFPARQGPHDFGVSDSGQPWPDDVNALVLGSADPCLRRAGQAFETPSVQCSGRERLDAYSAGESSLSKVRETSTGLQQAGLICLPAGNGADQLVAEPEYQRGALREDKPRVSGECPEAPSQARQRPHRAACENSSTYSREGASGVRSCGGDSPQKNDLGSGEHSSQRPLTRRDLMGSTVEPMHERGNGVFGWRGLLDRSYSVTAGETAQVSAGESSLSEAPWGVPPSTAGSFHREPAFSGRKPDLIAYAHSGRIGREVFGELCDLGGGQ